MGASLAKFNSEKWRMLLCSVLMPFLAFQLAGASYMEVHSAGGGINFTVEHTRSASEKELETLLLPRLERMIKGGECDLEIVTIVTILRRNNSFMILGAR